MNQRLIQEFKLFLRELVIQFYFVIFGKWQPPKWVLRKLGLTPREIHALIERAKMWKPYGGEKTLWQYIVKHSNNICYLCNKPITEDMQIEVDHRTSLWHFGISIPANLAVTHRMCNQRKGWRNEAEYKKKFLLHS